MPLKYIQIHSQWNGNYYNLNSYTLKVVRGKWYKNREIVGQTFQWARQQQQQMALLNTCPDVPANCNKTPTYKTSEILNVEHST